MRILNSNDMKNKYGIKDGGKFLANLPGVYRRLLLDTKYWGQNTVKFREKVIPGIIAISNGKASSEDIGRVNR